MKHKGEGKNNKDKSIKNLIKIDRLLATLIKNREKAHITNINNNKDDIRIDSTETYKTIT